MHHAAVFLQLLSFFLVATEIFQRNLSRFRVKFKLAGFKGYESGFNGNESGFKNASVLGFYPG